MSFISLEQCTHQVLKLDILSFKYFHDCERKLSQVSTKSAH